MLKLYQMYRPLTSHPFSKNHTYAEYRPGGRLLPYISCYWGMESAKGRNGEESRDNITCTDQSHLLKEFKRFHGTSPEQARKIADMSLFYNP